MKLIAFMSAGVFAQELSTVNTEETTSATTQSTIYEYNYDYYNGNSSTLFGIGERALLSNKEKRKQRKEAKAKKNSAKKNNKKSQPVTLLYAGTYAPTPSTTSSTSKPYTTTTSTTTSTTTTTTTSTSTTTTTESTTTTYEPTTTTSTTSTTTKEDETTTSSYEVVNPYADVPQGFEGSYSLINGYSAGYNEGNNANYGNSNYGNNAQNDNVDGISCFHCDAKNYEECAKIGKWKDCPENAGVCMVEMRKRGGKIESVCMGCKQKRACLDNKKQNFKGKFWQCRPKATSGPSVCRQCCKNGEQCENFDGVNYAGWKENLLQ
ncbi:unnamed protein product [Oikopleura dioica]|uniref:Uncharacterized protein n=1 Tax=Oikopleura dioica TaxID=34765 RepID=E4WXD1_OIKDI|nr:unnamed protein product [Oikopleura dioica]